MRGKYFNDGFCLGDYSYENSGRTKLGKLIYNFKYKGDTEAGTMLAELLTKLIQTKFTGLDVLTTVPPSAVSRIFQPVQYLSRMVSIQSNLSWESALLFRTKLSGGQKRIRSRFAKAKNVANLFQLKEENKVRGKRILLLDDIYDSGATVNEICRVLKSKGAHYIGVVTLAKTGFDQYGLS